MTPLEKLFEDINSSAITASEKTMINILKLIEIIRVQNEAIENSNDSFDKICGCTDCDSLANATFTQNEEALTKVNEIAERE